MGQKLGFFPMEGEGSGGDIVPPDPDYKPSGMGTRVYLNCDGKLDEVAGPRGQGRRQDHHAEIPPSVRWATSS